MRITFLNQKGGVGKTTLVLLLAGVLKKSGYDVSIDDRDPQGTASFFARVVDVPLVDPEKPTEYVVIDTPGHLRIEGEIGADIRDLVERSDRLILVTEKSPASVHGSAPMAKLIKSHKRADAKSYILFNRVRAGTAVGQQQGAEIAAELGLPHLMVELPLSSAFENAFAVGLAAVTGRHRTELLNIALEIMK